ncbi:hypothetical protein [Desulfocapsa sulfexigens]|uniref:hypothetical protein n=1 Tax=Desulfocapsa sulfexigens TaxID=65555 RepID=UPI0005A55D25|nr:hypothetical protein [Desulfocapsa sulfexigens]
MGRHKPIPGGFAAAIQAADAHKINTKKTPPHAGRLRISGNQKFFSFRYQEPTGCIPLTANTMENLFKELVILLTGLRQSLYYCLCFEENDII